MIEKLRYFSLLFILGNLFNLNATAIYVNGSTGDDNYDGLSSFYQGGVRGPKQHIQSALSVSASGDNIEIQNAISTESVNYTHPWVTNFIFSSSAILKSWTMNGSSGVCNFFGNLVSISDSLILTDGKIEATSSTLRLTLLDGCIVLGGNRTSFVEGKLYRENSSSTLTDLFFPIGVLSDYRPSFLSLDQGTGTNTYMSTVVSGSFIKNVPNTLTHVSSKRFWIVEKQGTAPTSNIKYKVSYDSTTVDDGVTDYTNLRLVQVKTSNSTWIDIGGTSTANFQGDIINTVNAPDFGIFSLANATVGTNFLGRLEPFAKFGNYGECVGAPIAFVDSSVTYKTKINKWHWNFGTGKPEDTSNLRNPSFTYASPGVYTIELKVTDEDGFSDIYQSSITVLDKPKADFSLLDGCFGEEMSFKSTSSFAGSDSIVKYDWNLGNGATEANQSFKYTYPKAGVFKVLLEVTSKFGCRDTQSRTLNVFALPSVNFRFSGICFNESTDFTGEGGNPGDSIIRWEYFAGSSSISTSKDFSNTFNTTGTYPVRLEVQSQKGCVDSAKKDVTIYEAPKVRFDLNPMVTGNDSIQCFKGNSFSWVDKSTAVSQTITSKFYLLPSNLAIGTKYSTANAGPFTVKMVSTTDRGCKDSTTKTHLVHDAINVSMQSQAFCLPRPTEFNSTSTAGSNSIVSERWFFGDGSTATGKSVAHAYAGPGNYPVKLVVTANTGCQDSTTVPTPVTARPIPVVKFLYGKTQFCDGDSAILQIDGGTAMLWKDNNSSTRTRSFNSSGTFYFEVSNGSSCISTDSVRLTKLAPFVVRASKDTTVRKGKPANLLASSGAVKYSWTPANDCETPGDRKTRANPSQTTTFFVLAESAEGCTSMDSVVVTVTEPNTYFIPNFISPNGDGDNDAWNLSDLPFLNQISFTIFNQFGTKVYESGKGYAGDWEGVDSKGTPLPYGNYIYIIRLNDNKESIFKGFLYIAK